MVGDIGTFAGEASSLPSNRMQCDGRALSRSTYSDLFAVIGTLWGSGDGVSTFNIPLIGDFVRASTASRPVGTSQDSQNLSHSHSITLGGGNHDHSVNMYSTNPSYSLQSKHTIYMMNTAQRAITGMSIDSDSNSHSHTGDTDSAGNSESCPKNKAVLYYIEVFNESSSSSGGLSEEQESMLQTVYDFISANCKQNEDGTFDFSKFFKFQAQSGQDLWLSEELRYIATLIGGC